MSLSKVAAAVAGGLIIASFFLPAVNVKAGGSAAREMFGVDVMRKQIEASRNLSLVEPLIEPALKSYEAFAESPSVRNLSTVCAVSKEILDRAAPLLPGRESKSTMGLPYREDVQLVTQVLWVARLALWLLPLIGLVQLVAPLATLRRGHAGFIGLTARFGFGLVLLLLAVIPVLGLPAADRVYLGSAVWALLAGSALMVGTGIVGVTRDNWWYVWLVQAGTLAVLIAFIVFVVQVANS